MMLLLLSACRSDLVLVDEGVSSYVIVTSTNPTRIELRAAHELQQTIWRMTDVKIPIVDDRGETLPREISVGNTNRVIPLVIDTDEFGDDGFLITIDKERLYILGGQSHGVLYGVYELLETHLGYRRYTPTVEHLPRRNSITIPGDIHNRQVPVIISRNMLYVSASDEAHFNWLRLTQSPASGVDRGRWGLWVHTFGTLVPEEKYYDDHPDYYTLSEKGERVPSQLCLTHPEVLEVLCSELESRMKKKPEALYWSVSQNDNSNYCRCDDCMKVIEEEGSPSGLMIRFVNKVAERFPDKVISTLAYQYTRQAPRHARPADNVNIMFCNIECNRSMAIADDESSATFRHDMEQWAQLTDNIILWDYMVQFSNLYTPFPNLRTLQPNMCYFAANNVRALFSQGNPQPAGEMWQLRSYIAARLLWNPDCDVDYLIDDFLNGFYGAAGSHLKQYIDLLHDTLEESGEPLSIFGNALTPAEGYLSPAMVDRYEAIFDEAEQAVSEDAVLLERVQEARLPLLFTRLEQSGLMPVGDRGFFNRDSTGVLTLRVEYLSLLDRFIDGLHRNGTNMLCEWMTEVDEYDTEMRDTPGQYLRFLAPDNKALHKPATVNLPLTGYRGEGLRSITDGVLGTRNYDSHWIGFLHDDFEIVVDLEEVTTVNEVNVRFIQSILDRLFLPRSITVETSADNLSYSFAAYDEQVMNREMNYLTKVYSATFPSRDARYIRIRTAVVPVCPLWHRDAGNDVWTMFDEVSVYNNKNLLK
jgi:hypothetical protein